MKLIGRSKNMIELSFARFYKLDNNIVVSEYFKPVSLDLEKSKIAHDIIGELSDYTPKKQLFIACLGLDASREARQWGLTPEANEYTIKSAIVCDSLAHRIIGNVLINLKGFPRPTKMFASVDKAIQWLNE